MHHAMNTQWRLEKLYRKFLLLPPEQEFLLAHRQKTGTPLSPPHTIESGSSLVYTQAWTISFRSTSNIEILTHLLFISWQSDWVTITWLGWKLHICWELSKVHFEQTNTDDDQSSQSYVYIRSLFP